MSPATDLQEGGGWNAAVGASVAPSGRRGGTLRLVSSADVDSLDPARTYYVWVWLLQRLLNRTLMAYPTDPGPAGLVPVPDLAEGPGALLGGHGDRPLHTSVEHHRDGGPRDTGTRRDIGGGGAAGRGAHSS